MPPARKLHVRLRTPHRGPRVAYVMDVLSERYDWTWRYDGDGAGGSDGDVALSYLRAAAAPGGRSPGVLSLTPAGRWLDAPPGATGGAPDWGAYGGVPCPTGDDPLAGVFYCLRPLLSRPVTWR